MSLVSIYATSQVTSGLVAKYSFNSGNATDDIGSVDGTVNGAILTADRFGNPNSAYSFIGGSYIALPDAPVLKSPTSTVSLWVKVNGYETSTFGTNAIYSVINSTAAAYFGSMFLSVATSGNYFSVTQNDGSQSVFGTSSLINTGNWQHYVVSTDFDSTKMYIDDVKQWSFFKNFVSTFTADSVYIGKTGNTTYLGALNGLVDDIRIYNRVLTKLEVDSLYAEVNPSVGITENVSKVNSISLSPNPTNSVLNITSSEPTTISVVNLLGQELMNAKIQGISVLDVSIFENGIYFVKDLNSGKTLKFIKK